MKVLVEQNDIRIYEATILDDDLLNGGKIFIGRQDDCHIILDDQQVSRHHACILIKDKKVHVESNSEFGKMSVDGNVGQNSEIQIGSKIKIGDFMISIVDLPQIDYAPASSNINEIPEDDIPDVLTSEISNETEVIRNEELPDIEETHESFDEKLSHDDEENESENYSEEKDNFNEGDSFSSEDFSSDNEDDFNDDGFNDEDAFSDDDGFSNDGFGSDSDSSEKTQVFSGFAKYSLNLLGEYAPFDVFKIEDEEIYIGRNKDKCKILLNDPEVSGEHAVIKKTVMGCFIEDLDSSNGTILNGNRVNKQELRNGDEFVIGDTSFTVTVKSDIIEAERDRLMPVEDGQEIEIEEVVEEEVDFDEFEGAEGNNELQIEEKSLIKKILKDPKKKRMAMFGLVGLLLLMLLDDEPAKTKKSGKTKKAKKKQAKIVKKRTYSDEVKQQLAQNYELAQSKYNDAIRTNERGYLSEAKEYINYVLGVDPHYSNNGASSLAKMIQEQSDVFARLEAEEAAEIERRKIQLRVSKLLEKLKSSVKKREVAVSEGLFSQILEIDPENLEVPPLKLEIESYKKELERKKFEEERKKAERKRMVDALAPGKTLYLKGEWYKAIDRLEKFTKRKGMDEDLINEATSMIKNSRKKLLGMINPLISKARSFKEGEDLKQAYETYGEVLRRDPSNEEALNEREKIFQSLENRSRKLYREALIAESLSLFDKAKEKFQEVQQISPINSEYYGKASKKLKNYLE